MVLSVHWNPRQYYKKLNILKRFKTPPTNKTPLEYFLEMRPCPYLQPIVSATSGKIIGAEVLLRFQDVEGKCYAPGTVIEALENSQHVNTVTTELINTVYEDFIPIANTLPNDFFFTFNICSSQLADDQLRDTALRFSDRFNMVLEIVERSILPIDDQILLTIEYMMNEGIQFAIDDFGAGHTSLKYLEGMNFTFLKIDRDLTMLHQGALLYKKTVFALVELARSLNMALIAEGVESQEQAALLMQNGVELLQGYYYCCPLTVSNFIEEYI